MVENVLKKLAQYHQKWVEILKSFGCDKDLAEDITQEMYIKMHKYLQDNEKSILYDDDINHLFVYITLKNMYFDLIRQKKRMNVISYEEILNDLKSEDEDLKEDDSEDLFNMYSSIEDWYSDDLYLELLEKDDIKEVDYTKDELSKYYMRRIFKEVFIDKINVSELSRNTKITYWSLRNTIKIIKKQIKKYYEIRKHIRNDF